MMCILFMKRWSLFWNKATGDLWSAGHVDGLAQDCIKAIANALELLQSCTKPSMAKRMTAVTPLLTHWSYCTLSLSHWYDVTTRVESHFLTEPLYHLLTCETFMKEHFLHVTHAMILLIWWYGIRFSTEFTLSTFEILRPEQNMHH